MGRLSDGDVLGGIVNRFLSPQINLSPDPVLNSDGTMRLPGLDNHAMGTIFEDLVRRFNEENNEEAGEHWTPRDAVELMAQLVFQPIRDRIESGTYLLYDGAIGTGGMLTIAEQTLQGISGEKGKPVSITTTLSTQQSDMAREHGEMLERYGFSLTPGENGQWTILTMPAVMVNRAGSPEEMLANLLDELEFQTVTTEFEKALTATMACHSAVRAGYRLTVEEMESIIQQLAGTHDPHTCPHGSPTSLQLRNSHIEMEFRRR